MSQWTKGKFKQRGPPPALFVHSSPAASSVSLTGGEGTAGGASGASGLGASSSGGGSSLGLGLNSSSASGNAATSTGMPSLPTLQRTASRLRQEVGGGPGASGSGPAGMSSSSSAAVHGQKNSVAQGEMTTGSGGVAMAGTAKSKTSATTTTPAASSPAAAFSLPLPLRHATSTRATDRTDALWAEMQATLEEVELSASEGTRVFGPEHDQKLAALRQAQIALAQAWARSEADEAVGGGTGGGTGASGVGLGGDEGELSANNLLRAATTTATSISGGGGREDEASASGPRGGPDDSGANHSRDNVDRSGGRPLEEEAQVDILLARKRREANDRYFQRVNEGVLDVVAKLEDVADAMRAVEQESVDIWGGSVENDNGPQSRLAA